MTIVSEPAVLVTGGGGRLGRLVVDALRDRGTRAFSLSRTGGDGHSDDLIVDLRDTDAVAELVPRVRVDGIVHLAAVVHGDEVESANGMIDVGLRALIRAVEPSGIVFASSSAVYGDRQTDALTEDSPLLGESPYAIAKTATEVILRRACDERRGLSVTSLRIFNISGPSFPDSLVQKLIAADAARPVSLLHPDSFVRDYIHQSDVVRSVLAALDRPRPGFRVLNVGAGARVSSRELLRALHIPRNNWIEVEGPGSWSWADNDAAVRHLGVTPEAGPTLAWAGDDPSGPQSIPKIG